MMTLKKVCPCQSVIGEYSWEVSYNTLQLLPLKRARVVSLFQQAFQSSMRNSSMEVLAVGSISSPIFKKTGISCNLTDETTKFNYT